MEKQTNNDRFSRLSITIRNSIATLLVLSIFGCGHVPSKAGGWVHFERGDLDRNLYTYKNCQMHAAMPNAWDTHGVAVFDVIPEDRCPPPPSPAPNPENARRIIRGSDILLLETDKEGMYLYLWAGGRTNPSLKGQQFIQRQITSEGKNGDPKFLNWIEAKAPDSRKPADKTNLDDYDIFVYLAAGPVLRSKYYAIEMFLRGTHEDKGPGKQGAWIPNMQGVPPTGPGSEPEHP